MTSERRLVAIMFTDIVGYTSLMQKDESTAIATVKKHQENLETSVAENNGEVIQYYGDGSLTIFNSATQAVLCAKDIQENCKKGIKVPLRIGIHIGEILLEDNKVFGDGVNLASRIESLGQTGTVLFSKNVYEKIRNNSSLQAVSIGSFEFKNVDRPMEVFALSNKGFPVPKKENITGKLTGTSLPQKPAHGKRKGFFNWLYSLFSKRKDVVPLKQRGENDQGSIAVLPFENYSDIPEQQYFVDGIADEIRSLLVTVKDLKVISRSSCNFYKNKQLPLTQIGSELDVNFVLEGRVQRMVDRVKVSAELSNTQSNKLVWSLPSYTRKMEDIFLLQNEIAQQVVSELKVELSDSELNRLNKVGTKNPEAYDLYNKGKALLHRGGGKVEELHEAKQLFERAIALDPGFSKAYVGLSDTYLEHIFWGRSAPKKVLDKALTFAFKALEFDNEDGESFGTLGAINFFKFEKDLAENYLQKAIELSPNYLAAYEKLAWIKLFGGDPDQALKMFEKAQALDPLSTKYLGDMGHAYFYSRQYEGGLEMIKNALEEYPDDNWLLWMQGYLYSGIGDHEKAIQSFMKRWSKGKETNWMLGYNYGKVGKEKMAEEVLRFLLNRRKEAHVPGFMIATVYMGMDDKQKALEWLEKDYEDGGTGLFFWGLKSDNKFDPLRDDPRFQDLLKKAG